ncbi:MAG: DUF3035 domain-containing protein [Alphaproteobacteria bacterium]|nr:DUF3035 domain-containing protein [Alphaproteobacteria bacterium]
MLRLGRANRLALLALLPALTLLAGCGEEMRKSFGLGKNAPDEFAVVRRAPLSLPPDFALRPPQPGALRPQEGTVTDQARSAVLRQGDQAPARPVDPAVPAASPRTPVATMNVGGAGQSAPRTPQAAALRPAPIPDPAGPSQAEVSLLRQAGADKSLPNIRSVITEDLAKLADADSRFIDALLVWQKKEPPTAVVVDAQKENQRLQENSALGKPATDGTTPTIQRKKKGLLEGLFF